MDETDEIQDWIGCDSCNLWFHYECVGVDPGAIPNEFVYTHCSSTLSFHLCV